jgi:hypothetical protein
MVGALSPGIVISPAGIVIPYRRPRPAKVMPKVEVLPREAELEPEREAYRYDRQGLLYHSTPKGLFVDTYF